MKISIICGSTRKASKTMSFIHQVQLRFPDLEFHLVDLRSLEMFHPESVPSQAVLKYKASIEASDVVAIITPEYIHNIPASLKSALEWITASGELFKKKTLAISFTPHAPRGEKAMISLQSCLTALDANVLATIALYHAMIEDESHEDWELLSEAFKMYNA